MPWHGAFLFLLLLAQSTDYLADGLKALDANQPAVAEPLLRRAVEAAPDDVPARFNLALALSLQQKDTEAIAQLRHTLELKPGFYEANLNLGLLLLRNKRAAEALPVLKEAVESKPGQARPNLYYAEALLATGDAAGGEQHYQAAAAADPNSAAAQLGLARSLLKQAKLEEADKHFHRAASLDSKYRDSLVELAGEYEKTNPSAAVAIYQQLPENPKAKARLNELLIDTLTAKNDFAGALPILEQRVQSAPTVANRVSLATAYRSNKQPDKAIEQLQLAAAADPSNYEVRMLYGRVLRDEHRNMPAAEQFTAATRIHPDSAEAWNELASVLIVSGNDVEGLAALDRIRALGKELPGDMYYRAITLDKLHQRKQAIEAYQQFLAADGGKLPDQEFLSRQRIRIIENELRRK